MSTLLEHVVPAVWHASWQAAALGLAVMLLLRCLGERVAPRWRDILWSIVVVRLLLVVAPASPWSAFNLLSMAARPDAPPARPPATDPTRAADLAAPQRGAERVPTFSVAKEERPTDTRSDVPLPARVAISSAPVASQTIPSAFRPTRAAAPLLAALYLAGCVLFGLRLVGAALGLRRRLSLCRPVVDDSLLAELGEACRRIGLKQRPALLVTPESISPCLVGTWRPRIIVPESVVTERSGACLRHVLAHELAHVVRADLWTNWLLLMAQLLHWFNPMAWWTIRELRAAREAACDELAIAAVGERDRPAYAATLVDLAESLAPSGVAPAMIGLIASSRRLKARIERLARSPSVAPAHPLFVLAIVVVTGFVGLTDAMPRAAADQPRETPAAAPAQDETPAAETVTLRGRCLDAADGSALAGARVRLFKAQGRTAPIVEIADTVTDAQGRYEFAGLRPPRVDDPLEPLLYVVFAEVENRPIGVGGLWNGFEAEKNRIDIRVLREKTLLAGTVVDPQGHPIAGASVAHWAIDGRPVPGILSAVTGPDGRFVIHRFPYYEWLRPGAKNPSTASFTASHPGYLPAEIAVRELPRNVSIALETGCQVTGTVTDAVTGGPAVGALVLAERLGEYSATPATTDAAGRFAMVLPEDRYNFMVRAKDRVCVARTDQECLAGQRLDLRPFQLIKGGFIAGQVVNAATGEPIAVGNGGHPVAIGLFGPSRPLGKVISPTRMATVDRAGRFRLRAAPGENFPYFINLHGDRMGWDTTQRPAVVVRDGETTVYNMTVTPEIPAPERLRAARKLIDGLPKDPSARTARILTEFRKLSGTVDETELWCSLMRALVALGRDAVPPLCSELDRTTDNRTLRRLAFALRAIGDARAVPALIRALPRTLLPSSSDYGLIVEDAALTQFMQQHDLHGGQRGGTYFRLGRPEREVAGALHKLTGQDFDDDALYGLGMSADPRRQALQRRLFTRHAERWQSWWEAHWKEFTADPAYAKVNLAVGDEPLPPPFAGPRPNARVEGTVIGETLSPATQGGAHARHFYDLDTGSHAQWPAHIPRDEAQVDDKQLAAWAAENGVDLMCVTHRAPDGKETFVLRSFGLKAWEITPRDVRSLDKQLAAGTLPQGRAVGALLMHYDETSKQAVPDANAAFLYVTRDGNMGLIETTDRVTRTADLTGMAGGPPAGVGFFTGVRFNLKEIIP